VKPILSNRAKGGEKTREIRRKLNAGAIIALLLAVAVSASSIAPAFAATEYHETASTLVRTYVEVPGQPKIAIFASHFEPTSDHGSGDTITVGFVFEWAGGTMIIPFGALADSSERVSLLQEVNIGFPVADNVKKVERSAGEEMGTLIVHVENDDADGGFVFAGSPSPLPVSFEVVTDGGGGVQIFDLPAGTYTVTQTYPPVNETLAEIFCDGTGADSVDVAQGQAAVTLNSTADFAYLRFTNQGSAAWIPERYGLPAVMVLMVIGTSTVFLLTRKRKQSITISAVLLSVCLLLAFGGCAQANSDKLIQLGTKGADTQIQLGTPNKDLAVQFGFSGNDTQSTSGADGNYGMQVCRIGKLVIVYWNSSIGGEITGNHPNGKTWAEVFGISSFELPPGIIILEGYGEAETETPFTMNLHASYGWRATQSGTVYSAQGTIIVPQWHYCGSFVDTPTPPRLNTLCDLTFSHD
jgi:hypothetical protein